MNIVNYNLNKLEEWDDFVLNKSINGTIYHTQKFLMYHNNKFVDASVLIYKNDTLICIFPCCKIDGKYYSHKGSTCGGFVISRIHYKLCILEEIINLILNHYKNLELKLSENIYFENYNNNLVHFLLNRVCKTTNSDISMYYEINDNIIDLFPKNDNKRVLKKYINNQIGDININETNDPTDYKNFYELLSINLKKKNNVSPLHSLKEFLKIKELLNESQTLLLAKNEKNIILSGAYIFKTTKNTYYTVYLMSNYCEKNSLIIYILYELLLLAKKNNIKFVNLGACSTNNGKNLLYSKYEFKHKCGTIPTLKYNYTYNDSI